jgi:ParB-like chromosome segregation protein Spo0J
MSYRNLLLDQLAINRANDRHGELENETAAVAWLFNNFEQHMRNLAKDIVETGQLFEPPLVFPDGDKFVVFDGNRRVTCLKLLDQPRRAPTVELQEYFC